MSFLQVFGVFLNEKFCPGYGSTFWSCRVAQSVEHSPANQEVPGSIPVSANSAYEYRGLVNLICAVSYWELMVGVALPLSKSTPKSGANEKGIDSLVARLIPTLGHPDQLT